MSSYPSLFRVPSPFRVQTKTEENSLPARRYIMIGCFFLGNGISFNFEIGDFEDFTKLSKALWEKNKDYFINTGVMNELNLKLWQVEIPTRNNKKYSVLKKNPRVDIDIEQEFGGVEIDQIWLIDSTFTISPQKEHVHIIVQPPPATTVGSTSNSAKRKGEYQASNRESVSPSVADFWNDLNKAQIVLKLPNDFDNTTFTSEPLSKYLKVKENEVVLNDCVMLNAQDKLTFNNGETVVESPMSFAKFLRLHKSPDGIVYGISTKEILIKKTYLEMIQKIEDDRNNGTKGCTIIGSPGIGKTHFALYLAFYITRRYPETDIIYQQSEEGSSITTLFINQQNRSVVKFPRGLGGEYQANSFYIADSIAPSRCKTIYTCLVTTPKNIRWHEFNKQEDIMTYYAPIWTEDEIWCVWGSSERYMRNITEDRVKKLIGTWGCIPRRVFVEYNREPKILELLPHCDIYSFLKNEGSDINDNYTGKLIHIIPHSNFTDKHYVPASNEIFEAMYRYYKSQTKDQIIEIIQKFARTSGASLSGRFFEMMAHDVLRKGGKFNVRCLSNNNENELVLQELEFKHFDEVNEITPGYYNIPKDPNFKSIDSLAPNRNGSNHLYQTTIAEKHNIKVHGLNQLKHKLDQDQPIHLYFVVPDIYNMFYNYGRQNYVTTENKVFKGWDKDTTWINDKVIQYVLLINWSDF